MRVIIAGFDGHLEPRPSRAFRSRCFVRRRNRPADITEAKISDVLFSGPRRFQSKSVTRDKPHGLLRAATSIGSGCCKPSGDRFNDQKWRSRRRSGPYGASGLQEPPNSANKKKPDGSRRAATSIGSGWCKPSGDRFNNQKRSRKRSGPYAEWITRTAKQRQ